MQRRAAIITALRTPVGRHAGALASVRPDDLAAHIIKAVVARSGIDPALIEDVYFGATNQAGEDNRNVARMAALLAGLPASVPGAGSPQHRGAHDRGESEQFRRLDRLR